MLSRFLRNRPLPVGTVLNGLKVFKSEPAPQILESYPEWINELTKEPLIVVNLQESFDAQDADQRSIIRKWRKQTIRKQNMNSKK